MKKVLVGLIGAAIGIGLSAVAQFDATTARLLLSPEGEQAVVSFESASQGVVEAVQESGDAFAAHAQSMAVLRKANLDLVHALVDTEVAALGGTPPFGGADVGRVMDGNEAAFKAHEPNIKRLREASVAMTFAYANLISAHEDLLKAAASSPKCSP